MLYQQLDWLLVWRVNGLVKLEQHQKQALRSSINFYLDDIRDSDLELISQELLATAARIEANEVTTDYLEERYQTSVNLTDGLLLKLVPHAEGFLLSLSPEQAEELVNSLQAASDKIYAKYTGRTEAENIARRKKTLIKSIQRVTGRLSRDQKEFVAGEFDDLTDPTERWYANQMRWQAGFKQLLQTSKKSPDFTRQLTDFMVYPQKFHSAGYRREGVANRQKINAMLKELLSGATDKQRRKAANKLRDYAKSLEKIVGEYSPNEAIDQRV